MRISLEETYGLLRGRRDMVVSEGWPDPPACVAELEDTGLRPFLPWQTSARDRGDRSLAEEAWVLLCELRGIACPEEEHRSTEAVLLADLRPANAQDAVELIPTLRALLESPSRASRLNAALQGWDARGESVVQVLTPDDRRDRLQRHEALLRKAEEERRLEEAEVALRREPVPELEFERPDVGAAQPPLLSLPLPSKKKCPRLIVGE